MLRKGNGKRRRWLLVGAVLAIVGIGVGALFLKSDSDERSEAVGRKQADGSMSASVLAAAKEHAGERVSPVNPLAVKGGGYDRTAEPRPSTVPTLPRSHSAPPQHKAETGKRLRWIPNEVRVKRGEALPCTGPDEPVNFEVFSAGSSVGGLKLNQVVRRCGGKAPVDEPPANFVNYIYGGCEIPAGASDCAPPLEIQTWPACERSLGDYTYEGKPMPYHRLPSIGGAEVVEILLDGRVEIYTKSSTIVIFAQDPALIEAALASLRSQQEGELPATKSGPPNENLEQKLPKPSDGAVEGVLSCRQS